MIKFTIQYFDHIYRMFRYNPYNIMFYTLLNFYSKGYKFDAASPPSGNVFCLISIAFFGHLLFLSGLVQFAKNPHFVAGPGVGGLYLLGGVILTWLLFYRRNRYHEIFRRFKDDEFSDSSLAKILGWTFLIFSILLPFIFALLRNMIYLGRWV